MALSRIIIPGDGATSTFTVNFALGYVKEADVTCRVGTEVDGTGNPAYRNITFLSENLLAISGTAPGVGVNVVFERITSKTTLLVDYEDGDIINAENLNTAQKQAIYIAQEALDGVDRAIKVEAGAIGFTIDSTIPDGSTLMKEGTAIIAGPDAEDITNAQANAAAAAASATASAASAAAAAASAALAQNDWVPCGPYTGTGVTENFLLPIDPGTKNNIFVVASGVSQMVTTGDFDLVYVTGQPYVRINIPTGIVFEARIGKTLSVNTPAALSVGTAQIQTDAVTNAKILNDAVTYAKMQNVSATARLLGRVTAGAGDPEEITSAQLRDTFFPAGSVVDSVIGAYFTNASITSAIPPDDTIPQINEGASILTVSLTPKSITNKFRITLRGTATVENGPSSMIWAVFRNSVVNALGAGFVTIPSLNYGQDFTGCIEYTPGVLTSETIMLRIGTTGGNNVRLNGSGSGRLLGGVCCTTVLIEEIKV